MGYDYLKSKQKQAIMHFLHNYDMIVMLHTGFGNGLCHYICVVIGQTDVMQPDSFSWYRSGMWDYNILWMIDIQLYNKNKVHNYKNIITKMYATSLGYNKTTFTLFISNAT